MQNNTITTNGSSGIGIRLLGSNSNTLQSNTITTNGSSGYGIYLLTSSNSNKMQSNTMTASGLTTYGIFFSSSNNNTALSNVITNSTLYGIYSSLSTGINLTANSLVNTSSLGYDIYINNSNNFTMWQNATTIALNSTLERAKVNITNNGNLTVQFYARAYVADLAEQPISGASVNSSDSFGALEWVALTAANGYTANFIAIDFTRNSTTDTDYNLHRATANITGYPDSSAFYNLSVYATNHKTANITLQNGTFLESCINYSTGNMVVNSNIECANISINVTGNITILAGGNLTLKNVTINFSMTKDGGSWINKTASGGLWIYDNDNNASTTEDASEIISNNSNWEYDFWVFGNSGNDNFTLQNSVVKDAGYGGSGSLGIQLVNVNNTKITNNNITDGVYLGLYLVTSGSNNITGNYINTTASFGYGISLELSSNSNTLQSNTITTSNTNGYGIFLSSSNSNTLQSNTITTSNTNGYGIYLSASSISNTLQSNTITASGDTGYGIWLDASSNSNITGNNITTSNTNGYGISLELSSNSNTLQSNTITTTGGSSHGIFLLTDSSLNTLQSNTI